MVKVSDVKSRLEEMKFLREATEIARLAKFYMGERTPSNSEPADVVWCMVLFYERGIEAFEYLQSLYDRAGVVGKYPVGYKLDAFDDHSKVLWKRLEAFVRVHT